METLIFIAIAVVITIIQKKAEKAREQRNLPPSHQADDIPDDPAEDSQEYNPPRSLRDLIRQFENAQRQATQGNIEPPTYPVEDDDDDDDSFQDDLDEDIRQEEFEEAHKRETEQHEMMQRQIERQRELNALEERAKSARESAAAFTSATSENTPEVTAPRKPAVSAKDLADVRKGFIWAKVLDEPRFKKRWSAQYR